MPVSFAVGAQIRLHRLFRHGDDRLLVVPLDHSVSDGPIAPAGGLPALVRQLAGNGVDTVVLHRGSVREIDPGIFRDIALIVHLSASTKHAPDPDGKFLVADIDCALRLGADAVSVHVNLGSREEARQIADLARTADSCDRWGVPLLAMMYPRGPRIADPRDPELVAHAASLAADLGAHIVKVPYTRSVAEMAFVIRSCPIPVVVAGGPKRDDTESVLSYVDEVMRAGAAGLAMGRNVFQAPDPGARARAVADLVHAGSPRTLQPELHLTGNRT
ncbi:2-amino-3,7-dideoxy-D-threo-hept-6-ulosonate synthase [Phytohabitans sp. LJ34]|uniref:2-amino-3,7-dideoxy-D-threo-hept-6-ulosonate synthase n=1 Tax=Phytohabitans sp. LJ34 TaxID=3452217 RepID=UPI003F88960F